MVAGAAQGIDWGQLAQVITAIGGITVGAVGGIAGALSARRSASTSEVEGLRDENRALREEINAERTARRNEITQLREEHTEAIRQLRVDHAADRQADLARLVECTSDRDRLRAIVAAYGNGGGR